MNISEKKDFLMPLVSLTFDKLAVDFMLIPLELFQYENSEVKLGVYIFVVAIPICFSINMIFWLIVPVV